MMRRGVRVAICAEHVRSNAKETLSHAEGVQCQLFTNASCVLRCRRTLLGGTDRRLLPLASGRRRQPKRVQAGSGSRTLPIDSAWAHPDTKG